MAANLQRASRNYSLSIASLRHIGPSRGRPLSCRTTRDLLRSATRSAATVKPTRFISMCRKSNCFVDTYSFSTVEKIPCKNIPRVRRTREAITSAYIESHDANRFTTISFVMSFTRIDCARPRMSLLHQRRFHRTRRNAGAARRGVFQKTSIFRGYQGHPFGRFDGPRALRGLIGSTLLPCWFPLLWTMGEDDARSRTGFHCGKS